MTTTDAIAPSPAASPERRAVSWGDLLDAVAGVQSANADLSALGDRHGHPYPDRIERAESLVEAAWRSLASLSERLGISTGDAMGAVERLRRSPVEPGGRSATPGVPPGQVSAELTTERLDELDRRAREAAEMAAKATPGRWKLWGMDVYADQDGTSNIDTAVRVADTFYRNERGQFRTHDATFIAAAREDVPELSTALQDATAEIRRLREREARLVHERECLGTAIADAAHKSGIYNGELSLTGPDLILLTQNMADELVQAAPLLAEQCRRQMLGEMAVADVVDGLLEEEEA